MTPQVAAGSSRIRRTPAAEALFTTLNGATPTDHAIQTCSPAGFKMAACGYSTFATSLAPARSRITSRRLRERLFFPDQGAGRRALTEPTTGYPASRTLRRCLPTE